MKKTKSAEVGRIAGLLLILALTLPLIVFSQIIVKQEIKDALSSGDTTLAIDLLQKEIKLDPSFGLNYYLLGQIYEKRNNLSEAEAQYQMSFNKDGKFYEGLYALGMVQLKRNKAQEALNNFSIGLKKSKDMKAAFNNGMALAHSALGDYISADKELRQAIFADSTNVDYHINLGDVNYKMKVYPLAISEYEKALALDTASTEVYFHLAEACLEMKDYNCALEKLGIVLRKDSTHAEAWMKAGGIYYKAARSAKNQEEARQRFKEAIGSYNKFIELTGGKPDSTTGRAYYEAGMSYLMIGGYDEAKQDFATVLSIPVEPKDIYFFYGRAFMGTKQYDSALVFFGKHLDWLQKQASDFQSGIPEGELYRWMGEAYENLKDYQNAIVYYKKTLESDSTQDRVLYGTAVAYNYLGDYRNALIYYRKRIALGVDERLWSIYYNAATCALYLAEKASQTPGQNNPGDSTSAAPDALAGVDFAHLAADYLSKVVEYKPDNAKAAAMLASIYLYQFSDCAKGVEYYEKVLAMEPDNYDALKSMGYAYFGGICQKNFTRALDYLMKALKKNTTECADPSLLLWIAQTYEFRAAEKDEAKAKAEAKVDFKSAFDWYNKVLKCEPGNAAARDGVDRVKFRY